MAHLSDLHFGASPDVVPRTRDLVRALVEADVDHVVITGDITDAGRPASYQEFRQTFAPLIEDDRVTVVPGNHDRLGYDLGPLFMGGNHRVDAVEIAGAYLVRVDSTGPHNRIAILSHGSLCERVLAEVDEALDRAPPARLVALLLHHHLLPLPEESLFERLSSRLGFPNAAELPLGRELLRRALGRCDLVLHGHRHEPRAFIFGGDTARPLHIFNAGSSVERMGMNVFEHAAGALAGVPSWLPAVASEQIRSVGRAAVNEANDNAMYP